MHSVGEKSILFFVTEIFERQDGNTFFGRDRLWRGRGNQFLEPRVAAELVEIGIEAKQSRR